MDIDQHLEDLAELLDEVDQDIIEEGNVPVEIEHCINIKTLSDYKVSCSYTDIVYVICILKDYLRLMDEWKKDGYIWDYYRDRFTKLADRLSEQIEYDYDKQMKKYRQKRMKDKSDDVGEDAMNLTVRRGKRQKGADYPTASRRDNGALICPDCGTREAMEDGGLSADEQREILDVIHKYSGKNEIGMEEEGGGEDRK